jgi:hypothetical protein
MAGSKLRMEKLKKTTNRAYWEFVEEAIRTESEPMFQRNARAPAATDSQLPRSLVPARSCRSKYKKIPKIRAPAECPKTFTICGS